MQSRMLGSSALPALVFALLTSLSNASSPGTSPNTSSPLLGCTPTSAQAWLRSSGRAPHARAARSDSRSALGGQRGGDSGDSDAATTPTQSVLAAKGTSAIAKSPGPFLPIGQNTARPRRTLPSASSELSYTSPHMLDAIEIAVRDAGGAKQGRRVRVRQRA
eukprot:40845-Chlamydomonas_euryale.AAC.9